MRGRATMRHADGTERRIRSGVVTADPAASSVLRGRRRVGIRAIWPYPKQVRSSSRMRSCVKFKKGDTVIYPQHGACIVQGTKKMEAFGATQEYLILRTVINEMTLSVPTLKTDEVGVRPPVNADELEDLVSVLSKPDPRVPSQLEPAVQEPPGEAEERRRVSGRRGRTKPGCT